MKGRGPTQATKLTLKHASKEKFSIEFDWLDNAIGTNRIGFNTFVALLSRTKASIIQESWDHVEEHVKNLMWQRKKPQNIHVCRHTMCRGGYEWPEKNMIQEKMKEVEEASRSDPTLVVDPPSPP